MKMKEYQGKKIRVFNGFVTLINLNYNKFICYLRVGGTLHVSVGIGGTSIRMKLNKVWENIVVKSVQIKRMLES